MPGARRPRRVDHRACGATQILSGGEKISTIPQGSREMSMLQRTTRPGKQRRRRKRGEGWSEKKRVKQRRSLLLKTKCRRGGHEKATNHTEARTKRLAIVNEKHEETTGCRLRFFFKPPKNTSPSNNRSVFNKKKKKRKKEKKKKKKKEGAFPNSCAPGPRILGSFEQAQSLSCKQRRLTNPKGGAAKKGRWRGRT